MKTLILTMILISKTFYVYAEEPRILNKGSYEVDYQEPLIINQITIEEHDSYGSQRRYAQIKAVLKVSATPCIEEERYGVIKNNPSENSYEYNIYRVNFKKFPEMYSGGNMTACPATDYDYIINIFLGYITLPPKGTPVTIKVGSTIQVFANR